MADYTPITEIRAFIESGTTATARTNIGLGSVDDTSDLNKPISTATLAVTDSITARDWVEVARDTIDSNSPWVVWAAGKISVMYLLQEGLNLNYPEIRGELVVDRRTMDGASAEAATYRVFTSETGAIYTSNYNSAAWTPWQKVITSEAGVISGDLSFSDQLEATTQAATTDDSLMTRSLGDARYSTISDTEVIVKTAADLAGALDPTKVYRVDGEIDMGTQTINTTGGIEINGYGIAVSKLYSTESNYTMFVDTADDAGTVFLSNLTIDVSGTTSQVFDLDNSGAGGAVELSTVNFENCTSLGILDAFRQFLVMNSFWLNCDDGLTFAGTWAGGASIQTLLVRNFDPALAGGTVFTGLAGLTFGSRFISNANINTPAGATVYDFEADMFTEDADFELILGEYTGLGTVVAVKSPVIDNSSTKSRFRDNNGLNNTYVGGRWYIDTGDAVDTVIASSDTYVKVAGTTTEEDLQWLSSAGNNDLTYDSEQCAEVQIAGSINVSAASGGSDKNITLTLRHWDDSASAYVDLPNKARGISTSAASYHNIAVIGYAVVDAGDRIELWIENNTDTVNLAVDEGSLLSVSERAN